MGEGYNIFLLYPLFLPKTIIKIVMCEIDFLCKITHKKKGENEINSLFLKGF